MMVRIAPSILAADAEKIEEEISLAFSSGAEFIHIDVMDGIFVPAKTFSPSFVARACLASPEGMVKDIHLMCDHPYAALVSYLPCGGDLYTFHLEACQNEEEARRCLSFLHAHGKKVGISIKPATPVESLAPYLGEADLILVMSVEPGKGGQSYLKSASCKISFLNELRKRRGYRYLIEVDGGINESTAAEAASSGADVLVAGSYLFGHPDFADRLRRIRS